LKTPVAIIGEALRAIYKLRFKLLGLATIKDIPTDEFRNLVLELRSKGWFKTYEYSGFDAWIDYGKITLRRKLYKITCEWDNWSEGSLEGPKTIIQEIANDKKLEVTYEWRWSEYDEPKS